jgi:hypothetical protein
MYINNLDDYVEFLCEHKISSDAYMFMLLLALDEIKLLYEYVEKNRGLQKKELNNLVERGYLINDNSVKNQYFFDTFNVSPRFKSILVDKANSIADEAWSAYPTHIWVEGTRYNARNIDKEEFTKKYMNKILNSRRNHKKVLEAIEYGKTHDLLNVGLKKFIATEMWNDILDEMKVPQNDNQPGSKEF